MSTNFKSKTMIGDTDVDAAEDDHGGNDSDENGYAIKTIHTQCR